MKQDAKFEATRWSLIHRVQAGGDERALSELCEAYWFPLYGWARRSGASPEEAEDLVQGFFSVVLRKELFAKADAAKGRLRTFLLTAFRRYQGDVWGRENAERRAASRTVSLDAAAGEEWYRAAEPSMAAPEAFFDRQWALAVLEQAVARLGREYALRGREGEFARLRRHLTSAECGYAEDALALGISEGALRVAIHRVRERFREALRAEVASMQHEGEDVDEELGHLFRALEG